MAGPETDTESEPLKASFSNVPASHDGESFTFGLRFSEDVAGLSYRTLRDEAFAVTGGAMRRAQRRQQGSNQGWTITVEPDSRAAVTVTLPAGSVETSEGRGLERAVSATIAGPVDISVSDARVEEGAGAVLAFAVTLSRAASEAVTVDYTTSDGSAQAGVDYTRASGTLTFEAGESSQTINVAVLDDSHDEGEETLTLRLSNPSEGRLTDAEATGTIENTDPLPRALLARFGRATALQVMEQVEERLEASREPGLRGRFAGRELRRGMGRDMGRNFLSRLQSTAVQGARDTTGVHGDLSGAEFLRTGLGGGRDVLMGSGFVLNRETGEGGSVSLWSRGMESRFSGRDGELSLDGGVWTTMFGADYAKGPLMAGLMLSHRRGLGGYRGADVGEVASSVMGLHPWVGYRLTERVMLWGVTGYGRGSLSLTPGEALSLPTSPTSPTSSVSLKGGLSMSMLAGGVRGDLVNSGVGGFGLAFKADALWVGTGSEAVEGPAGRMAGTEAVVTRMRTALEASRGYVFGRGIALEPSLELGLRSDGGDAETGAGADVAASLIASDPWTGLSVDVRGADATNAPGRRVPGTGRVDLVQLRPGATDAAGLHGTGGALMGRAGDERYRHALGPADDGGARDRRPGIGQPPRCRARLRAAGREPLGWDPEARCHDLRAWARLPAGLQPGRRAGRRHELPVRPRRPAPRKPAGPGEPGPQPDGPSHGDLVDACEHAVSECGAAGPPVYRPRSRGHTRPSLPEPRRVVGGSDRAACWRGTPVTRSSIGRSNTSLAPLRRQRPVAVPRNGPPFVDIDVMHRAVASRRDPLAGRLTWKQPPRRRPVVLGRAPQ